MRDWLPALSEADSMRLNKILTLVAPLLLLILLSIITPIFGVLTRCVRSRAVLLVALFGPPRSDCVLPGMLGCDLGLSSVAHIHIHLPNIITNRQARDQGLPDCQRVALQHLQVRNDAENE